MINSRFIKNWIPDDKIDNKKKEEEDEYNEILETIQKQDLRIDKATFQKLYDWKAKRSKKYLEVEKNYKLYESALKEILDLKDEEKIKFYLKTNERKKLPGILDPVASTILHFMYPDKFPIKDVRTVGTLRDKGLLTGKVSYNEYRKVILEIRENCGEEFSLRQIDRALFTYNENKELVLKVLEGKKLIDEVAKHLIDPQERIVELIRDLENHFKKRLLDLSSKGFISEVSGKSPKQYNIEGSLNRNEILEKIFPIDKEKYEEIIQLAKQVDHGKKKELSHNKVELL